MKRGILGEEIPEPSWMEKFFYAHVEGLKIALLLSLVAFIILLAVGFVLEFLL